MTTATKIKKALKGKNLTFVNVENILKDYGYTVVFFNTPFGDEEIKRYNLEYEKSALKAFTYSQTAHIVFINGALHSDDRLYLALHELGHIALGHIGDGKLATRNSILIDMEANHFAYTIIHGEKTGAPYILISSIVLSLALIFSTSFNTNNGAENFVTQPVNVEDTIPSSDVPVYAESDMVYVTPSGNKFHRKDCRYLKHSTLTELPRSEASKGYAPCKVCKP